MTEKKPPFTTKSQPPDAAETVEGPAAKPRGQSAAKKKTFKRLEVAPVPTGPSAASRIFMVLGLLLFAGLGLYYFGIVGGEAPKPAVTAAPGPTAAPVKVMGEEERKAYVAAHVLIEDVAVGPDQRPDGEGGTKPVGGLFQVTGNLVNNGESPVSPVFLQITLLAEDETVLGSYVEDVTKGRPAAAGTTKPFKFVVPEKKGYAGKFLQKVQ
ncbi:MAG: FxLYD domain-containing protein [Myxococcota bacterium]